MNNLFKLSAIILFLMGTTLGCSNDSSSITAEQAQQLLSLNSQALSGKGLDPEVWERTINEVSDEDLQQYWWGVLLTALNFEAIGGRGYDPEVWERTINELSDKDLQQYWRAQKNLAQSFFNMEKGS